MNHAEQYSSRNQRTRVVRPAATDQPAGVGGGELLSMRTRRLVAPLLLISNLFLAGCGTTGAASSFYRLGALPPAETSGNAITPSSPALLVGPVNVPDYLDRPQLVTRSGPYELQVDEFSRWGGSLREEISLALVENLTSLLGPGVVAANTGSALFEDALQLRVDLLRLEGSPAGEVELLARWSLLEDGGRRTLLSRRSHISVLVNGTAITAIVAAYSDAVAAFSREVASALQSRL